VKILGNKVNLHQTSSSYQAARAYTSSFAFTLISCILAWSSNVLIEPYPALSVACSPILSRTFTALSKLVSPEKHTHSLSDLLLSQWDKAGCAFINTLGDCIRLRCYLRIRLTAQFFQNTYCLVFLKCLWWSWRESHPRPELLFILRLRI
jgi:hypothetical protein